MTSELRKKTQEAVDNLRDRVDGCDLAMLIDAETHLVLCKSSKNSVPQDQLDQLANFAQMELAGVLASALIATAADGDILTAFSIGKDKVVAVIRSQGSGDDVLVSQFENVPNRSDLRAAAEPIFNLSTEVEAA